MSTKDLIQSELDRLDEALLNEVYLFITTYIQAKQNTTRAEEVMSSSEATTVSPLPIRDHSAFLNSYSAADEGLYDDIAG
jgi:hypothetical protein